MGRERDRTVGESGRLQSYGSPLRRLALALAARTVAVALALSTVVGPALAHGGSLGQAARESLSVPAWLVVGTGGAAVGASFLLASFATDRSFVAALHAPRRRWPGPEWGLVRRSVGIASVFVLVGIVVTGFVGPADPLSNPAVVVVWAGWWAGFAMSTYLVGNAWPLVNPWRTMSAALPDVGRSYAWRWGAWPSVAGLLVLVWLEVVSPLADEPVTLTITVVAYSVVTVAGALVYGTDTWFGQVDPVSRVFRLYGQVAPVGTDADGDLEFRLPGGALTEDVLSGRDEVAFVLALLWVTTFDGLVATPPWAAFARWIVGVGVPPALLYPAALVVGFALFWAIYLGAARLARRTAPTFVAADELARRFAPPLLAIAAGYHLAHFLTYFLSLLPALALAVTAPLSPVDPPLLVVPGWFGGLAIAAILVGHVLAILAAHAVAFELFPDRLQAVRSQYPFTAAMVVYTMVSLWVVTRPDVTPPFI